MSGKYKLLESYVLLEKLASGGMADVYLGKKNNSDIQKFVSIKKVLPPFISQIDFVKMFKEEIKVSIGLHHSNIVSYLDYIIIKDQIFLVMEYINGVNLRQLLNDLANFKSQLSVPAILHIASQIASALDYAHRKCHDVTGEPLHIVHRDINPTNVMVSFDGDVKVIDFGIARSNQKIDKTKAGIIVGKMSYLSPEQVQEKPVDGRSDIFSLAAVVYELFSGKKLFAGDSDFATLNAIMTAEIPKINQSIVDAPPEIDLILTKALSRNVDERYQSMSEFKHEIERILFTRFPDFRKKEFDGFIQKFYEVAITDRREKLKKYLKAKFETKGIFRDKEMPKDPEKNSSAKSSYVKFNPLNRYDSTQPPLSSEGSLKLVAGELPEGFETSDASSSQAPKFDRLNPNQLFSQAVSTYTKPKTKDFFTNQTLGEGDYTSDKTLFNFLPYWLRPSNYTHLVMIIITGYAIHSYMKTSEIDEAIVLKAKSLMPSEDITTSAVDTSLNKEPTPSSAPEVSLNTEALESADYLKVPVYKFKNSSKLKSQAKVKSTGQTNQISNPVVNSKKYEFGFVNLLVDDFDRQNMIVTVNGKELFGKPPFYSLKLPVHQKVTIHIRDKKNKKQVYRSVNLAVDGTQIVRIKFNQEATSIIDSRRAISSDKK